MKHIKLYERFIDNKYLLAEIAKRFFDNKNQLIKFFDNVKSDPQWIRQPIQGVVNLGYDKWVKEEDFPSYSNMLKWCLKEYGPFPEFLIQFLRYYQYIMSDGHLAYYEAGMASSKYKSVSDVLDIHKSLLEKFQKFFLDSDIELRNDKELFDLMNKFKIEVHTDDETKVKAVANVDYLSELDQDFYKLSVDFLEDLEDLLKEFITDVEDYL